MRPAATAAWLAGGAFASTALGLVVGVPLLLPLLNAAVAVPVFARRMLAGAYGPAFRWMLVWAVLQSAAMFTATAVSPDRAAEVVLTGPPYAAEMIHWVRTGVGPEGSPSQFLPIHARHFGGFVVLSILTASTAGLVLGTYLLNYMNFYVAMLSGAAAYPGLAAAIGWPVWAVVRVVGYIACAVGLAPVGWNLWARLRPEARRLPVPRRYLVAGAGLVVLDVVLKATLAPVWRSWLVRALEG